jgi:hypothetical protein
MILVQYQNHYILQEYSQYVSHMNIPPPLLGGDISFFIMSVHHKSLCATPSTFDRVNSPLPPVEDYSFRFCQSARPSH